MRCEVYTVGHSTRSLRELLEILDRYGVKVVIDVRRFPTSKRYPHFRRESLERELSARGIEYVWLGRDLGGFRRGGYESYMETEEFARGVERLLNLLERGKRVAILCRERLWFKCHRRFISDVLVGLGYRVIHIILKEWTYVHKSSRKPPPSLERRRISSDTPLDRWS